jgi:hypothetical protein
MGAASSPECKTTAWDALIKFGPKAAPAVPLLSRFIREQGRWHLMNAEVFIQILRAVASVGPGAKEALPDLQAAAQVKEFPRQWDAARIPDVQKAIAGAIAAVSGEAGAKK